MVGAGQAQVPGGPHQPLAAPGTWLQVNGYFWILIYFCLCATMMRKFCTLLSPDDLRGEHPLVDRDHHPACGHGVYHADSNIQDIKISLCSEL